MEIVRSAQQHAVTPPKTVDPVTASSPEGALPFTAIVAGLAGSLLITVIVPETGPKPVGWNRIGTVSEPPAAMFNGYDSTSGTRNAVEFDVIASIVNVHLPLLFNTSGSSAKCPTQTFPKFPVSARIRFSFGVGALPDTATMLGLVGSLLKILIVPAKAPGPKG
jgi:hypothetical protein